MADPAYIVDGVLTDGEAWVGIGSSEPDAASSVTFTSTDDGQVGDISQNMDLFAIVYGQGSGVDSVGMHRVHVNGVESGGKYNKQALSGTGSAATAGSATGEDWVDVGPWPTTGDGANLFAGAVHHLFDINSGKYKSGISTNFGDRDGSGEINLVAWTYLSQAPISSVTFKIRRGGATLNWMDGSRLDLFGILPRMVA